MLSRLFVLWICSAVALSCQGPSASGKSEVTDTEQHHEENDAKVSSAASSSPAIWPKADSFFSGIPIYTTFEEIAPLFQQDNDTTYVINFWATWCKPCVKELPYFEELNGELQGQKAKVVLVSLDFPKKIKSSLIPFLEEQQLTAEVVVLLDGKYNDWIDKIDPRWTGAIPATLIYKGEHRRFIGEAVDDVEELRTAVDEISAR